jgi:tRNA-intron endonuclease
MEGDLHGDEVHVGGDARQRFHDSRGYGTPLDGNRVALSRVEAAHLLLRGDLDAVDGMGFQGFLAAQDAGFTTRFLVYADLRDRGFYLSPARDPWAPASTETDCDFVVYPRGKGPRDGEVEYRLRVAGERTSLAASTLDGVVLAVVDEESDITYFDAAPIDPGGATTAEPGQSVEAVLLDDRVFVWESPDVLHDAGFYGQPLGGRGSDHDALQLSLLEAAYLAATGGLAFADGGTVADVIDRGRAVEGDRFDRRLRVYRALRDRGMVPKTGYKYGADFRVYETVESVDDLGHSTMLVRVLPGDHAFDPRDIALDVRLAHGVRKRMVFALDDPTGDTIRWLAVSRLTP